MIDLTIICDNRETKVNAELKKRIPKLAKKSKINLTVITQVLDVADFVVSDRKGVERKRGDDFVSSYISGHLEEQMMRLQEAYEIPVLLIEDWDRAFNIRKANGSRLNISAESIYGMQSKIEDWGIHIVVSRDAEDTAILLSRMVFREQKEKGRPCLARSRPKMESLEERQNFFIQGMLNTGPEKSTKLLEIFGDPASIFNAIGKTEYTPKGTFKKVDGNWPPWVEIKGIGPKWTRANEALLWG